MSEMSIPQSDEVNLYELQVCALFDEAVVIVKTINSWPNHDVPNQNLYQSLKSSLYSIATKLGYDVGNPDSRAEFHLTLWRYWHEGELDYQINSPVETTNLSNKETIGAEEIRALISNALQLIDSLDYNDKVQIKRLIVNLEFIAVTLGFDTNSNESMHDFTVLLDMIGRTQEHLPQTKSDFDLAA